MRPSLTPVIEAAYQPAGTLEGWLDAVTARAATLLEGHHGAVGRILDTHTGAGVGTYSIHVTDEVVRRTLRAHEQQSRNRIDFLCTGRSVLTATVRDDYTRAMNQRFRAINVHDMLHFTAHDGGRYWVTIALLTSRPTGRLWCPRMWASTTKHLAAGLRLQRRVHELEQRFADADGGDDREALRREVRRLDTGGPGLEPTRVHQEWRGLVDGSWSIVDRHDAAGRRYLVAVPAFGVRDPRGLSAREAQVAALVSEGYSEKWVAYTLGIARTTVANHLATALAKLGLPSSLALVAAFHEHDEQPPMTCARRDADAVSALPRPAHGLRMHPLADGAIVIAYDLAPAPRSPQLDGLPPAQRRVVVLALAGLSDKAIAARLGRSRHTISNQLRRAYAKLGVNSRNELSARVRDPE